MLGGPERPEERENPTCYSSWPGHPITSSPRPRPSTSGRSPTEESPPDRGARGGTSWRSGECSPFRPATRRPTGDPGGGGGERRLRAVSTSGEPVHPVDREAALVEEVGNPRGELHQVRRREVRV